jgi:nonsense-mediated mRNA decay protein 3
LQIEKGWKHEGAVDLEGMVQKLCKGEIRNASFDPQSGELSLIVEQAGAFVEVKRKVAVNYAKTICIDCSRTASGYFEAIIQVRGKKRERVEKKAGEIANAVLKKSFIPKIEELKEGIDIYCGSRNEAIGALNALRLGFLRTEKLAGERDGKRLYRTTLAIRV